MTNDYFRQTRATNGLIAATPIRRRNKKRNRLWLIFPLLVLTAVVGYTSEPQAHESCFRSESDYHSGDGGGVYFNRTAACIINQSKVLDSWPVTRENLSSDIGRLLAMVKSYNLTVVHPEYGFMSCHYSITSYDKKQYIMCANTDFTDEVAKQ